MTDRNDGGYAFPRQDDIVHHAETGMTLRDYFAGQVACGIGNWTPNDPSAVSSAQARAKYCYHHADAMIAARGESK